MSTPKCCKIQEFPPLKRTDNASHTQHQYQTSKDQCRIDSIHDIMTSALENCFDEATCSVLKSLLKSNSSSMGEFYKGLVSLMAEFLTVQMILKVLNLTHYPNVTYLYKLCLTLSAIMATTERSYL